MNDFIFLTKEQCFGSDEISIIEKRGIEAEITDFSILLEGFNWDDLLGKKNRLLLATTKCSIKRYARKIRKSI